MIKIVMVRVSDDNDSDGDGGDDAVESITYYTLIIVKQVMKLWFIIYTHTLRNLNQHSVLLVVFCQLQNINKSDNIVCAKIVVS